MKKTCEIYLAINEYGDYEVRTDESEVRETLDENVGGTCCKIVKLLVIVSVPRIEEVTIDVPNTAGQTTAMAE